MSTDRKTLLPLLLAIGGLLAVVFIFIQHDQRDESPRNRDSSQPAEPAVSDSDQPGPAAHSLSDRPATDPIFEIPEISRAESLEAFLSWIADYRKTPAARRPALINRGLDLAQARRPLIRQLIHENPEMAIAHALTLDQYHALPREIRALVEQPFSASAEIDVFPRCDGASATLRSNLKTPQNVDLHLTFSPGRDKTETLDAFTWGWRLEAPSRIGAPVQGIRLDGLAAIREGIFQALLDSEIAVAETLFPMGNPDGSIGFATGSPLPEKPVVALGAGQLFYFVDRPAFDGFQKKAAAIETRLGPKNGARLIFETLAATIADPEDGAEGFDIAGVETASEEIEAAEISGNRKVLMIRVDFSDKTGSPIGASTLQSRMDGAVDGQCRDMSFNKLYLTTTVETPLVRMPKPSTYYNGKDDGSKKNSNLYNDALAAAAAAGINTSGYNHRCIIFKSIGMGYCGLATVGGGKIWLPCHGSKVIVHELGHNFGVSHASFHDPDDDNDPLGAGSSSEYGDNTDIMGGGGVTAGHFHPQAKTKLAWLDSSQRYNFNAGNTKNTYRIYRFDHPETETANARRTVRVFRGTKSEYLWIGYRQRFSGSNYQNYLKGAQVYWQKAGKSKSWLVDLTPGGGKNNSGLGLGRTFSDTRKDIHITALKRGGSSPDQWLEVQVTRGPFSGNRTPTLSSIRIPARVPVNESISLGAEASDPDGDPLAFDFDFKDGTVVGNDGTSASRTYTWTSKGSKNLTVTVSDRKGRVASQTVSVNVQNRLSPPAGLTASEDDFFDRVQLNWGGVSGGTSYTIYRSLTNSLLTAEPIGTASTTSYADTSGEIETTYYYWVQALGSGAASNLAGSVAGSRSLNPPTPPENVTATQGSHLDRILLSWQATEPADVFKIFRGTDSDPDQAVEIGETTGGEFTDLTASAGTLHHYWIRSGNSSGLGDFSDPATGFRRLGQTVNVQASNGTGDREVFVSWEIVEGAEVYEIYRNDSPGPAGDLIGTTSELSFTDFPPEELRKYHYSVRAQSSGAGFGERSSKAIGFRTIASPGDLDATDGYFDDRVRVTWTAVPGANPFAYKVYRSRSPDENSPELLGMVAKTTFDDTTAETGASYFYFVQTFTDSAILTNHFSETPVSNVTSPMSPAEPGHRASEIQFRPDTLIGKRPTALRGNGIYNYSGNRQQLREISRRGKRITRFAEIQNDGEATPGRFRITGPKSTRDFAISYRENAAPFANVSAQVTRAGYFVELEPDAVRQLTIEVKPTRRTRGKSRGRDLKILSSSTEVSRRGDLVRVFVQTR